MREPDDGMMSQLIMDNLLMFLLPVIFCYARGEEGHSPRPKTMTYNVGTQRPSSAVIPYGYIPDLVTDKVDITWLNSTTSSIAIRWGFANDYTIRGSLQGSEVEYFVPGGKFTSRLLKSQTLHFVFHNLVVATTYTICVKMYEVRSVDMTNSSYVLHCKCMQLDTIPYIREDSIATLALVMCYFIFMALIGYIQWKRKATELYNKKMFKSCKVTDDSTNTSVRWREVAERQRLYLPGSSIEDTR